MPPWFTRPRKRARRGPSARCAAEAFSWTARSLAQAVARGGLCRARWRSGCSTAVAAGSRVEIGRDERIRVLRVVARLNVGGPALHTVLLTERLDPARYDSRLVAGTPAPDEGDYLELQGRSLEGRIALPSMGRELRGGRDLVTLASLVRIVRGFRPHVVHTHTAKAGALGRLAAILCRVPVVVHTFHGHVLEGYFSPAKTRVFVEIERRLARRTQRIVTVSESVRAELVRLGIGRPEQVAVVPLGLELERFARSAALRGRLRGELGLAPDVPLVGIVARLVPIKAHEVFLEAAARIAERLPAARFVIVGDGERRAELEALASHLGIAERTIFLGWRSDLDRVYADLDVVALASRNEGSPVALIEAMAAGRAVVSTRVGGVPDLVTHGESGLLVERDDVPGMADAVARLLGDPALRERLARRAKPRAVGRFSAGRLVAEIDALYTDLLAERGRAVRPASGRAEMRPLGESAATAAKRRASAAEASQGGLG